MELRIPRHGPSDAKAPSMCEEILLALTRQVAGVRLVWSTDWLTHDRAVQELAAGRLDTDCGYYRTAEREARILYSHRAVIRMETVLAVRADDPAAIATFDELRATLAGGHDTILVNAGSAFLERLHRAGIEDRSIDAWAAHSDTNLRKLMSGRGRFFIFRNPGLTEVIQNNGWDGRVRILPHPLAVEDQYMVFSPTWIRRYGNGWRRGWTAWRRTARWSGSPCGTRATPLGSDRQPASFTHRKPTKAERSREGAISSNLPCWSLR
ncbi:transporter substrate-binding domain-containing protein [Nitrospirillum sp. BR 11164]|uniref:substrate-binding periplasmic protein n=1 Tax=Nitrospirillum sp. BR 11164 TaxID=3104324 RepID=UPI002AFDC9C4|nr:transporter substrate-binding domain-containing protein [Nitrospirillum sp. BR 11164]MEA1647648.1 transporter substrate-binding domain-containing protein [Nitrospirillum sp. BR 11164]